MQHEAELKAILKQVELWPAEERQWLARKLTGVDSVAGPPWTVVPLEQRRSFSDMVGIANPEGRSFTDEEVDEMRYEALKAKHLK